MTPDAIPAFLAALAAAQAALTARLLAEWPGVAAQAQVTPVRLLKPREAAARVGCSRDWLYRHADQLGAVREGRLLRFTDAGLAAFARGRTAP